jgi:F0F1-type ATP synthase membrane subunit c/vacuolar-type H+-ATPase subunit K
MEINESGPGCVGLLAVLVVGLVVLGGVVASQSIGEGMEATAQAQIVAEQQETARLRETNLHREQMYVLHAATQAAAWNSDILPSLVFAALAGAALAGVVIYWFEKTRGYRD